MQIAIFFSINSLTRAPGNPLSSHEDRALLDVHPAGESWRAPIARLLQIDGNSVRHRCCLMCDGRLLLARLHICFEQNPQFI